MNFVINFMIGYAISLMTSLIDYRREEIRQLHAQFEFQDSITKFVEWALVIAAAIIIILVISNVPDKVSYFNIGGSF